MKKRPPVKQYTMCTGSSRTHLTAFRAHAKHLSVAIGLSIFYDVYTMTTLLKDMLLTLPISKCQSDRQCYRGLGNFTSSYIFRVKCAVSKL